MSGASEPWKKRALAAVVATSAAASACGGASPPAAAPAGAECASSGSVSRASSTTVPAATTRGLLRDRAGAPLTDAPASLKPWLGRLSATGVGESGLHKRFESELAAGRDVTTTFDAALHRELERAFAGIERGAAAVIDMRTGAIRALFSTLPHNSDPNLAQRHNATAYPKSPGATALPFVATAALAHQVIEHDTKHTCTGSVTVGKRLFRCTGKHGASNVTRAMGISDFSFFYRVSESLPYDDVAQAFDHFGFGRPVQAFPSAPTGSNPQRVDFASDGRTWREGYRLLQVIGQGVLTVTPLQLARAFATRATGRHQQLRLTEPKQTRAPSPGRPIDARYKPSLLEVEHGMYLATGKTDGTAAFDDIDVRLRGVTGSTQLHDGDRALPWDMGWFAGWAPQHPPGIAFAFQAERKSGREVARIAQQLLARLQKRQAGSTASSTN